MNLKLRTSIKHKVFSSKIPRYMAVSRKETCCMTKLKGIMAREVYHYLFISALNNKGTRNVKCLYS